jgi:acetyltransferase-like isoleucine patch superfamily enzyme
VRPGRGDRRGLHLHRPGALGDGAQIGANCHISNATIAAGAVIHPFTHIDGEKAGASVGEGALIGPFARLRPGAQLGREVHIGNFVEVKNSTLADGAKANHLAYLGDATVGERVNYGAGSITANYDGANKHRTVIEADVHIGSNCVLVAPVTIGAGGTVGGGSTITKSTEPGALSVARGKQVSRPTGRARSSPQGLSHGARLPARWRCRPVAPGNRAGRAGGLPAATGAVAGRARRAAACRLARSACAAAASDLVCRAAARVRGATGRGCTGRPQMRPRNFWAPWSSLPKMGRMLDALMQLSRAVRQP